MATYLELKAKAEKLFAEAEELRVKEIDAVVNDIKQKIETYGLTPKDLGFSSSATTRVRKTTPKTTTAAAAKYRGPNGESWSGGRGRKPKWVTEALAKGKKIEDFAVK
ncbi:H-NS histone family protein [Caenimonas sedimenti]|uniref:H-NS histone family protein n=1 Tax=Caenimonas sedimenti TaxID=2596921 RepID=A0A562ZUN4_9BURK|nr:H-NS histone family protein [Caenimonas sedimenti]TWO72309.1 H-NS histone family protein [Caenimonas sedimenti]